jgi:hypothetical protein
VVVLCLDPFAPAAEPLQQTAFSHDALSARLPVVREHSYVVNARVRPLLLFWIGRDNVGGARITWRADSGGRRAFELLVGSDPARAPRRINRWGFIVEELNADKAEILGVMKESNEQTIEEAEAQIKRQDGDVTVFKAARTTITGSRSVGGLMTVHAPGHLTYHQLDALLALIPAEPPGLRTVELPSGTQKGFLIAMESLIRTGVGPCSADHDGARKVPAVSYVYNQTLYDLSLLSCGYEPELLTATGTFAGVVDGRFQVRNRRTKYETKFRVFYGTSGELREVPVRAVFKPRWWMEVELVLDRSAGGAP